MKKQAILRAQGAKQRGSALVPTLIVVSVLVVLALALMTSGLSGARSVNQNEDDYRLSSAVESAATLAAERVWSGYLLDQGGEAGDIQSLRAYLAVAGIPNMNGDTSVPPKLGEGLDLFSTGLIDLPADGEDTVFNNVRIDSIEVVRFDNSDATELYFTVSASTRRGSGVVSRPMNRALQIVYTIQPDDFAGFEYGILANNVNCIFCHTQVDSVERFYETDPEAWGTHDRVKVGALESLMLRDSLEHINSEITDADADSYVAGTVYLRGVAADHNGIDLTGEWENLSFQSYAFNDENKLETDLLGNLTNVPFSPAVGDPLPEGENLYVDYPEDYSLMTDGELPPTFPPPIPDNGGINADTGLADTLGAGNRIVDDEEFYAATLSADGTITSGAIAVAPDGMKINNLDVFIQALLNGNTQTVNDSVEGNLVLTGTPEKPVVIDGTVTVDGDLIISGVIQGEGSLIVRGNVYVPGNLIYNDGVDENGNRTFGQDSAGNPNALGLAAGGNILIGDYQRPQTIKLADDGSVSYEWPSTYATVAGDDTGEWSFGLSEMALFNRAEWARAQIEVMGPDGEMISNLKADGGTYEPPHPDTGEPYVPRYYSYGPGDTIPIYKGEGVYYDPELGSWISPREAPLGWNEKGLDSYNDLSDLLSDANPDAVVVSSTPSDDWLNEFLYKVAVEYFKSTAPTGSPMEIDGLLYTNNAIFGLVNRYSKMRGQMLLNGALVASDLGLLVPGYPSPEDQGTAKNTPNSPYNIGLRLNYDRRVKDMLSVFNPYQVKLERTFWNPSANMLN